MRSFAAKKQDFYKVLGLNKSATRAEIKKAYAKLAQEYHPDKNPDPSAKEKFSSITEAYQTLNDPKKREVYDQYGMSADEQKEYGTSGFGGQGHGQGFGGFWDQSGDFSSFENMFRDFDDFFNFSETSQKKTRATKGSDVYVNLQISFLDAINGAIKDIVYKIKDNCKTCSGSGSKPGTNPVKCGTCGGKGNINYRQGPMNIQMTCGDCNGMGSVIKHYCGTCRGSGNDMVSQTESVNIPKGINSGQNMRVSAKGNKGEHGGPRGDLIIRITVKDDPYFRRNGYDIHINRDITISEAVLGSQISVKTLNGSKKINVPPGISSGSKLKLANEGVNKLAPNQNQKGDMFIHINIKIPKNLNAKQREIFEQLKALEEGKDVTVKTDKTEEENAEPGMKKKIIDSIKNMC
jgi:molecular chaperone DnaJ